VKRNIEREQVYKRLSLKRKEDLLSQIAHITFEAGNYLFKQREVERYITQYIQNLPEASTDPEVLELDSVAVLKSIEAQHGLFVERARGIYSFSHLKFHEFFTARKIVTSCNPYAVDDPTLQGLVSHVTEKRWREVFLLTVGMLDSADVLVRLMKARIDDLLAADEKLQQYRNIGHDWQFNDTQKQLLQQYYDANKLLVDCLNSDCYVSREVRQEIEETLLLPIAAIEKMNHES
jgi:predicted NACHT family NTPase